MFNERVIKRYLNGNHTSYNTKFCSKECHSNYQSKNPQGLVKLKGKFSRGNLIHPKPIECYWDIKGCLIETAHSKDKEGYGNVNRNGKNWRITRWIFYINNGFLPEIVMHTCDNPSCINPMHLIAGTIKENSLDMVKKGRAPNGNKGKSKLTEGQVKEIKSLIPNLSLQRIADKFKVSKKLILMIKQGKKHKDNDKNDKEKTNI